MRVVVAGFGNVLRGDDGFGVAVVQRLLSEPVPAEVHVLDIGIGGIHLVQELLDPADALIAVDALDFKRDPGTVLVVRPDVDDVTALPLFERRDALADMHYASPQRAFLLARGLGVLPPVTLLVGCQAADPHDVREGLSPQLVASVDVAAGEVRRLVRELGVQW